MKQKAASIPLLVDQSYEIVDIDSIVPSIENVNEGDLGAILQSVDANGFYGAVVIQASSREIIAGKHRWMALKEKGASEVPVLILNVDDKTARRIRLADNRTNRLGIDNPQHLAELLESIRSDEGTLDGTAFTDEDLQQMLDDLGSTFLPDPEPEQETGGGDGQTVVCPHCHKSFVP